MAPKTKEPKAEKADKPAKKEKKEGGTKTPSPYIVFCGLKRDEVSKQNPNATFGEKGKLLGAMWRALTDAQKASYKK